MDLGTYILAGFAGILGLIFFESHRIYKCTTVGKPPVPNNQIGWHIAGLLGLAFAAASLSIYFALGEFIEGVILGFAVPSGLKAVVSKESSPAKNEDRWKDEKKRLETTRSIARPGLSLWIKSYFDIYKG